MGHVNKPHGTKGEVFVWSLTDHPERTFVPGVVVRPAGADDRTPDPELPPLRIEGSRPFRRGYLLRFGGVPDRDAAETLRGRYLLRPLTEVAGVEEDELLYHEMLAMRVETVDGRDLGRVTEVYELRHADMLEVRGATGSVLVPFTREIVTEIDREGGRIVIDPPEGLLEL